MFPGGIETSMGTSYHVLIRRIDLVSKIYSLFYKCVCFWSAVMFSVSLHFVFAVKPAGTREHAEVEESPQEVPSLGNYKFTV